MCWCSEWAHFTKSMLSWFRGSLRRWSQPHSINKLSYLILFRLRSHCWGICESRCGSARGHPSPAFYPLRARLARSRCFREPAVRDWNFPAASYISGETSPWTTEYVLRFRISCTSWSMDGYCGSPQHSCPQAYLTTLFSQPSQLRLSFSTVTTVNLRPITTATFFVDQDH